MNEEALILHCCACNNLLHDPIQLDCLHNACWGCISREVIPGTDVRVECPTCKDASDITSKKVNTFLAARIHALKTSISGAKCHICASKGYSEHLAEMWCNKCGKSLCKDCASEHRIHSPRHVIFPLERYSTSNICDSIASSCPSHEDSLDLLCLTCKSLMCSTCIKPCIDQNHEIRHRHGESTTLMTTKIKEELVALTTIIEHELLSLQSHLNLPQELDAARRSSLDQLRKNKKVVLESVHRAYEAAEKLVEENYDSLGDQAAAVAEAAGKLNEKASYALMYSKLLIQTGDITSLLNQHQLLLQRLQQLTSDLHDGAGIVDIVNSVVIETSATENIDNICMQWIGFPKILRGSVESASTSPADDPVEVVGILNKEHEACSGSLQDQRSYDVDKAELCMLALAAGDTDNISHFEPSVECSDMTITSEGKVVLAVGDGGLWEFDSDGTQLSTWKPQKSNGGDWISVVSAVDGSRVVAGFWDTWTLALLKRNFTEGEPWLVEKHIAKLEAAPRGLSVYGDTLAVIVEDPYYDDIVVMSLCCGHEMFGSIPLSSISGVAVVEDAVVAAGQAKVEVQQTDPEETAVIWKWREVLQAYSLKKRPLWRRVLDAPVVDMCPGPSGRVIYFAVKQNPTISALSTDDGHCLQDILTGAHGFDCLSMLAVGARPETCLAVASDRGHAVKVFHAIKPTEANATS